MEPAEELAQDQVEESERHGRTSSPSSGSDAKPYVKLIGDISGTHTFDPLLFFADAGNGDQFAFVITAGKIRRPDIFAWDHENDSRTWVAPSLAKYLEWWLSGDLKL